MNNYYAAFMDLEKAYNRDDREALQIVLNIYGVGRQLEGVEALCRETSASVQVDGVLDESFPRKFWLRQRCVMSPWMLKIFMDGCMRSIKIKVENVGARLKINGICWTVVAYLFADFFMVLVESHEKLQSVVD